MARHLRGSSLLLAGRFLALGVDFAAHVLLVRHLAKADFGAYAYALAVAQVLSKLVVVGLPETLARHTPVYREHREIGKAVGAVLLAVGIVLALGGLVVLLVVAAPADVAAVLGDRQAATLLAVLVLIVPSDGLNLLLQSVFAALGRVRTIFVRQYILVPGLRLAVVFLVVTLNEGAEFMAVGYVLVSALGVLFYGSVGVPVALRVRRLRERVRFPVREVVSFAGPVFVSALFALSLQSVSTVVLGVLADTREVAAFQAVLPAARLGGIVMATFSVLFIPTIARQFAQDRLADLRNTYLSTTAWITVVAVPGLALTTVFASVVVPVLFGQRYASSVAVLVLLAIGNYINASAGPNDATLRAFRRLRHTLVIDLGAMLCVVVLNLLLVPLGGAQGAALANVLSLLVRNLAYVWALKRIAGINLLAGTYARLQAIVAALLAALLLLKLMLRPDLLGAMALTAVGSAAAVIACRPYLDLEQVFPELRLERLARRLPLARPRRDADGRERRRRR
jgi:O-antigen/teichoic acid export membrane protein